MDGPYKQYLPAGDFMSDLLSALYPTHSSLSYSPGSHVLKSPCSCFPWQSLPSSFLEDLVGSWQ